MEMLLPIRESAEFPLKKTDIYYSKMLISSGGGEEMGDEKMMGMRESLAPSHPLSAGMAPSQHTLIPLLGRA